MQNIECENCKLLYVFVERTLLKDTQLSKLHIEEIYLRTFP